MAKKKKTLKNVSSQSILILGIAVVLLVLLTYFAGKTQFYKASADFTTQTLKGYLNSASQVNCVNQSQVKLAPYVIYPDPSNLTCVGVYGLSSLATPFLGQKVSASGYYGNIRKYLDLGTTSYKGGYYFYAVSMVPYSTASPTPYPVPTTYPGPTPIGPYSTPNSCICSGTYDIPCPNSLQILCPELSY